MDRARWYRSLATKVFRPYSLGFWFVGMDEKRSIQRKGKYKRRIAGLHYGWCCPHKKNAKTTSEEQHVLLPQKVQSALRLAVGFSNNYNEV
jgi:hypothetical protein